MAFMCQDCGKVYGEKQNFQRHRKQCADSSGTPDNRHLCPYCGKQFARSDSLLCHISTMHLVDSERRFQGKCDYCDYTTCHKSNLTKHLRTVHVFPRPAPKPKPYPCSHCSAQFSWLHTLQRHLQKEHNAWSPKPTIRKCPLCTFISKEASLQFIYSHFEEEHNISMVFNSHRFSSVEEFDTWKYGVEKETVSLYRKMKTRNENYLKFVCNRSGKYVQTEIAKQAKPSKRRTCKMNGFCPARITGRTTSSGEVSILFQETHVGHEHERRYARLTKEEKLAIKEEARLARIPKLSRKRGVKCLTEGDIKVKRTRKPKDSSGVRKTEFNSKLKCITGVVEKDSSDQVSNHIHVNRTVQNNSDDEVMDNCFTLLIDEGVEVGSDLLEGADVQYVENEEEEVVIDTVGNIGTLTGVINEEGDIVINGLEGLVIKQMSDLVETREYFAPSVSSVEEVCETMEIGTCDVTNIKKEPSPIIDEEEVLDVTNIKKEPSPIIDEEEVLETDVYEEVICEPFVVEEVNELIAGEEVCVTTLSNQEDERTASVSLEDRKRKLINDVTKYLQDNVNTVEEYECVKLYFQSLKTALAKVKPVTK